VILLARVQSPSFSEELPCHWNLVQLAGIHPFPCCNLCDECIPPHFLRPSIRTTLAFECPCMRCSSTMNLFLPSLFTDHLFCEVRGKSFFLHFLREPSQPFFYIPVVALIYPPPFPNLRLLRADCPPFRPF